MPRVGYRLVALAESLAPDKREPERSPYPGLSSFSSSDSAFFFGREGEVESVRRKLESRKMLALIGPSGAGKSSFLRAGLVPSLPEGVRSVFFTPGNAPMRALTRSLVSELSGDTEAMKDLMEDVVAAAARWRKRCERALVVIDAFEELFTLNLPEAQREFAETLGRLAVEADVHVLLSMRDDFLFRCHEYEVLAHVFLDLTPLGPLKGTALRRALVEPALSCGYRFETEELVEEMLEHGGSAGQRLADRPEQHEVLGAAQDETARSSFLIHLDLYVREELGCALRLVEDYRPSELGKKASGILERERAHVRLFERGVSVLWERGAYQRRLP